MDGHRNAIPFAIGPLSLDAWTSSNWSFATAKMRVAMQPVKQMADLLAFSL